MISQIIFVAFLASVNAKTTIVLTDSPIEIIGQRVYRKELLTDKYEEPKELAYDSSSRNLFFMYMDYELQNSGRAFVNIVTKQTKRVEGISRNKATAVDTDTGEVYFGSDDGLYKYDPITNTAANVGLYNINVYKIVIRNNEMYLIDANDHMIYKIYNEGETAVRIGNMKMVMTFDVDNSKNVHLVSTCGVFCAYKSHELIKNKDLKVAYNFFVEDDITLALSDDGIYKIDCLNGTAERMGKLNFSPSSMIFGDYGDIYYSASNSIFRLVPVDFYHIYNVRKKTQK